MQVRLHSGSCDTPSDSAVVRIFVLVYYMAFVCGLYWVMQDWCLILVIPSLPMLYKYMHGVQVTRITGVTVILPPALRPAQLRLRLH